MLYVANGELPSPFTACAGAAVSGTVSRAATVLRTASTAVWVHHLDCNRVLVVRRAPRVRGRLPLLNDQPSRWPRARERRRLTSPPTPRGGTVLPCPTGSGVGPGPPPIRRRAGGARTVERAVAGPSVTGDGGSRSLGSGPHRYPAPPPHPASRPTFRQLTSADGTVKVAPAFDLRALRTAPRRPGKAPAWRYTASGRTPLSRGDVVLNRGAVEGKGSGENEHRSDPRSCGTSGGCSERGRVANGRLERGQVRGDQPGMQLRFRSSDPRPRSHPLGQREAGRRVRAARPRTGPAASHAGRLVGQQQVFGVLL